MSLRTFTTLNSLWSETTGGYNRAAHCEVVHLVPNIQTLDGHAIGTLHFDTVLKTKYVFIPVLDFLFFAKIRLKIVITNIWCGVSVGFCDLLGAPYAPGSKIPTVKGQFLYF